MLTDSKCSFESRTTCDSSTANDTDYHSFQLDRRNGDFLNGTPNFGMIPLYNNSEPNTAQAVANFTYNHQSDNSNTWYNNKEMKPVKKVYNQTKKKKMKDFLGEVAFHAERNWNYFISKIQSSTCGCAHIKDQKKEGRDNHYIDHKLKHKKQRQLIIQPDSFYCSDNNNPSTLSYVSAKKRKRRSKQENHQIEDEESILSSQKIYESNNQNLTAQKNSSIDKITLKDDKIAIFESEITKFRKEREVRKERKSNKTRGRSAIHKKKLTDHHTSKNSVTSHNILSNIKNRKNNNLFKRKGNKQNELPPRRSISFCHEVDVMTFDPTEGILYTSSISTVQ